MDIERRHEVVTLNIDISDDNDLTQEAINFGPYGGAILEMPAGWDAADIEFMVCDTETGTFLDLYDSSDAQVVLTTPTASRAYEIPAEVYAAQWIKLATSAAQTADRVIKVHLKG